MRVPRLRFAALALVSGLALGGCAYDMYGDPYGYGGLSVGVGSGYYGGYGYPYGSYGYGYPYGGYGYGAYDPFGWYGNYYYPGSGIYVYDHHRTRHVWTDDQRRYWQDRHNRWQSHTGSTTTGDNWSGWDRRRWRNNRDSASVTTTGTGEIPRSSRDRSMSTTRSETVRVSDTVPAPRSETVRNSDSVSTPRRSRSVRHPD